jgi:FAD/FMN-containing dehydrogenase
MIDTAELRDALAGRVFTAADPGFADEVSGYNLAIDNTPDVAVAVSSATDVVAAVRFARASGLTLRVQSTGHGASAPITDGVLVTTSRLDAVSVDASTRTAVIGAGARWAAVTDAAAEAGLAAIGGSSHSVGVVGYITGGGLGPLSRSHGFSSDYVRSFTVVTGRGDIVEASAESHPELFWALRGGKSGLGVVTEVRIGLVEMPSLYAGSLLFESDNIETVVRGWIDYTATAAESVTSSIALLRFPPIDAVPAAMRGRNFVSVRFAFAGSLAEGERLAAPLRALAPVFVDSLGDLPASQTALIHNDPEGASPSWTAGTLLSNADDDFATALLAVAGPGARVPFVSAEVRHLGGATRRDVDGGSAVGGRSAGYTFTLIGAPEPSLFTRILPEAAAKVFASIASRVNPETTVNFDGGAGAGTPAWSQEVLERLAAVRAEHDPDGVFAA